MEDVTFEIRKLNLMIKHEFETECKMPTKLQSAVIAFIFKNKDRVIYQKDIEKEFFIRSSTATAILKSMERNNLIIRKCSENDKRYFKLDITDKSMKIVDEIKQHVENVKSKLTRGLTDEEISSFLKIILKLQKNMEEQDV